MIERDDTLTWRRFKIGSKILTLEQHPGDRHALSVIFRRRRFVVRRMFKSVHVELDWYTEDGHHKLTEYPHPIGDDEILDGKLEQACQELWKKSREHTRRCGRRKKEE